VVVGGWNTAFGYGVFAMLTHLLGDLFAYAHLLAAVIAHIAAITVAYAGYKVFVFKTKGNYLREYLRFHLVYGVTAAVSLMLLPILVALITPVLDDPRHAPYVAQAAIAAVVALLGFIGHQRFSFRQ
jgi:putative flippase GtrA